MAEHDSAAEQAESVDSTEVVDVESAADELDAEDIDAEDIDAEDADAEDTKKPARQWLSNIPKPIAVGVAIIVALVGLGGWLGYRVHQDHQVQAQRNLYVQVCSPTQNNKRKCWSR
jgi:Mce-associated membrane protein